MSEGPQSEESSINSIAEFINTLHEESEMEVSSVDSVNVEWNQEGNYEGIRARDNEAIELETISGQDLKEKNRKIRKMYWAAGAVLLNAVCMGFGATYSSTATESMKMKDSAVKPNQDQIGWIGSLLAIGALFGGLVAGQLSQSIGRKGALLFSTIPFMLGWLLIAYASTVEYIYVGRIIAGFSIGLVSVTTPMYLVEISTPEVRGLLGASFQLFVTIGILVVSVLGAYIRWTWLAIAGAVLSVLTLVAMMFVPESPRWLMEKKRLEEALWTVSFLHGDFLDPKEECKGMQNSIDKQPKGRFSFKELKAPDAYKPAIYSFCLMFFQQFSGVNAILFYTVSIFNDAKITLQPTTATIIVATVQVIATFVGSILMDKAGRKVLLIISGICMILSLATFGGFDFIALQNKDMETHIRSTYGWLPLVCVAVFISAFSLGFGPIPWLMVSEMTTARLRSATSGAATAFNWACVFTVTKSFHYMTIILNSYGTYWFYAGICLVSCLFTFFFLPETKGKNLEEIQSYFNRKRSSYAIM